MIAIAVNYGPRVSVTTYRRPECEYCNDIDCGVHPLDIEMGYGERYVEPCAFADACECCGGDCPLDYTGQRLCTLADYEVHQ